MCCVAWAKDLPSPGLSCPINKMELAIGTFKIVKINWDFQLLMSALNISTMSSNHYCYPHPYSAHHVYMECTEREWFGGRRPWVNKTKTPAHLCMLSFSEASFAFVFPLFIWKALGLEGEEKRTEQREACSERVWNCRLTAGKFEATGLCSLGGGR